MAAPGHAVWPRVVESLLAAAALAASFAVIGAPLWLSAGIGALGGLRVAAGVPTQARRDLRRGR